MGTSCSCSSREYGEGTVETRNLRIDCNNFTGENTEQSPATGFPNNSTFSLLNKNLVTENVFDDDESEKITIGESQTHSTLSTNRKKTKDSLLKILKEITIKNKAMNNYIS